MGFQMFCCRLGVTRECGFKNQVLFFKGFCPAIIAQHQLVANVFLVNILEDCDHMPRVAGPHQGKMKLPIIVQLAF